VGSLDPVAHTEFAAGLGFGGVLYPWATQRPTTEVQAVASATRKHGLTGGCIVFAPLAVALTPVWVTTDAAVRTQLLGHVDHACRLAEILRSRVIAVIVKGESGRSAVEQLDALVLNLRWAAEQVQQFGCTLGLEPLAGIDDMLPRSYAEGHAVIKRVSHPNAKLIFDTGHAELLDGLTVQLFREVYDEVCLLQLSDQPGRVEPGAGRIDFVSLLVDARRRGYSGLIELEHGWSEAGEAGEALGLLRLREIDAIAGAAAAA
jgi:hydroxypyruvate isomerase